MVHATPISPLLALAPLVAAACALRGLSWLCDRPALLLRLLLAGPRAVVWALAGARPAARMAPGGNDPPKGPRYGADKVHPAYVPMRTMWGSNNWHSPGFR